jgi:S-adenosylmethionine-diacylglycerol 3-amino-3-carboxypropyl transferase
MSAIQNAIASEEARVRRPRNQRLHQAVHRHNPTSRQGIQERLFTLTFSGLVYPQIWEDPVVDLAALKLQRGEELIAIASGGCNVLSYLAAAPISITAVDLNPAHVALKKVAGCRGLSVHSASLYRGYATYAVVTKSANGVIAPTAKQPRRSLAR